MTPGDLEVGEVYEVACSLLLIRSETTAMMGVSVKSGDVLMVLETPELKKYDRLHMDDISNSLLELWEIQVLFKEQRFTLCFESRSDFVLSDYLRKVS